MVERDVKLIKLLLFFFSKLGLHLPHPVDHKIGKYVCIICISQRFAKQKFHAKKKLKLCVQL